MVTKQNGRKIKKVIKGLKKASNLHKKQAKTLKNIIKNKSRTV
tara:strand:+ start:537 stop:665 length:129 start_codon:yes stop_codon:yes gene_type:complete